MDSIDKWKEKEKTSISELRKNPKEGVGKLIKSVETKTARIKRENIEELIAGKIIYIDWLVLIGRWAVVGFLSIYGIILFSSAPPSFDPSTFLHPAWKYYFVVIIWGILNALYHRSGGPESRNTAMARIGCDILLSLFIVHYTGGAHSICFALFMLVSIEAAVQLRGSLLPMSVAGVTTVLFGLLLCGEATAVLEYIPVVSYEMLPPLSAGALFLFSGLINFMSVAVVSHIAGENRKYSENTLVKTDRDPQTGTYNRQVLFERLTSEIERCSKSNQALSIILAGVDDMEEYNREFGYQAGDKLLATIGDTITNNIRDNFREDIGSKDIACRYSGDIFAVILPEAKPTYNMGEMRKVKEQKHFQGVSLVAERLRGKIGEITGDNKPVRTSIGGAHWPYHGNSADELVKEAYRALMEAKSQGKDRVVVATKGA